MGKNKEQNKDESLKIEFGDYLQHLIEEQGLSLQGLGREAQVTAGYINRVVRKETTQKGPMIPSPEILKKLAPPLSVSYVDLMRAAGHLDEFMEKPDLYQLILAGLVRIDGMVITDIEFAKKLVVLIKSTLELSEDWLRMTKKQEKNLKE